MDNSWTSKVIGKVPQLQGHFVASAVNDNSPKSKPDNKFIEDIYMAMERQGGLLGLGMRNQRILMEAGIQRPALLNLDDDYCPA